MHACRLLAAMLPDQSSKSGPRAAPKEYGPNTNNLSKPKRQAQASSTSLQSPSPALASCHNTRDRPQVSGQPTCSSGGATLVLSPRPQAPTRMNEARGLRQSAGLEDGPDAPQGSDKGTSPAGGGSSFGMQMGSDLAEGADDLMIQEDGVDWGDEGGVGDPTLQHAMAVILSRGEHVWMGYLHLQYLACTPTQLLQLIITEAHWFHSWLLHSTHWLTPLVCHTFMSQRRSVSHCQLGAYQ